MKNDKCVMPNNPFVKQKKPKITLGLLLNIGIKTSKIRCMFDYAINAV